MKKTYLLLSTILISIGGALAQGDDCANALSITAGVHSADGPSSGGGYDHICASPGWATGTNSDWYSFTPPCNGTIDVSSDYIVNGGGFDSRLTILSGTCGSLSCEANDDDGGTVVNFASKVNNMPVVGGTTYYFQWDDRWGSTGPFEWTLDFTIIGGIQGPTATPYIDSAVITWVDESVPLPGISNWNIEYGLNGFTQGSGTVVNVSGTQSDTYLIVTDLLPETSYCYYIAVGTGPCAGNYQGPFCFTTLPLCPAPIDPTVNVGPTSALLDWELGFVETEWDLEYGLSGTIIGAGTQNYGLISSVDSITGLTSCTDYDWYVRAVCTNYTPTEYSVWVGPNNFSTDCICPAPSDLDASVNADSEFNYNINWVSNGSETNWEIQYDTAGFFFGSGQTANAIDTADTLTGLVPNTIYEYYVRAICTSTGTMSGWAGPFQFTTEIFCPEPIGIGINNLSTNSVNLNWPVDGFTSNWTIEWGPNGFALGTGTNSPVLSNNVTLTSLTPETDYCYYVQSNCGSTADSSSSWAGPYCWTTLSACQVPSNLSVLNITGTAITLDWQPGGSETSWNVKWGIPGFDPVNGPASDSALGVTTSWIYVTGLNPGSSYEFYVQADCGGTDGTSSWAGPYSFNTVLTNDLACNAIELLVDGNVNAHTNAGATVNGEQAIIPPMNWQNIPGHWDDGNNVAAPVWFKFKAPASGKVKISTVNSITTSAGTRTEIALYATGNCAILAGFNLLAANTYSFEVNGLNGSTPGSDVLSCELNPGQYYYMMVDTDGSSTPGVFGISVTNVDENNAGTATPDTVCGDGTPVELFDLIDNYSTTSGTWYNPSITNPNFTTSGANPTITLPTGAGTYSFDYLISNACGRDTVTSFVTTVAPPSAGLDGSFTTCNTDDVILVSHLNGIVQLGGTWSDVNGIQNVSNGIFHGNNVQLGTYVFAYVVGGNGACGGDTALVTITLTDDCLGLDNNSVSNLSVYPNPVSDVLTIANLQVEGDAIITLYDAQGKIVVRNEVSNITGNYTIDMTALETGVYMVEVITESTSEKARIIRK